MAHSSLPQSPLAGLQANLPQSFVGENSSGDRNDSNASRLVTPVWEFDWSDDLPVSISAIAKTVPKIQLPDPTKPRFVVELESRLPSIGNLYTAYPYMPGMTPMFPDHFYPAVFEHRKHVYNNGPKIVDSENCAFSPGTAAQRIYSAWNEPVAEFTTQWELMITGGPRLMRTPGNPTPALEEVIRNQLNSMDQAVDPDKVIPAPIVFPMATFDASPAQEAEDVYWYKYYCYICGRSPTHRDFPDFLYQWDNGYTNQKVCFRCRGRPVDIHFQSLGGVVEKIQKLVTDEHNAKLIGREGTLTSELAARVQRMSIMMDIEYAAAKDRKVMRDLVFLRDNEARMQLYDKQMWHQRLGCSMKRFRALLDWQKTNLKSVSKHTQNQIVSSWESPSFTLEQLAANPLPFYHQASQTPGAMKATPPVPSVPTRTQAPPGCTAVAGPKISGQLSIATSIEVKEASHTDLQPFSGVLSSGFPPTSPTTSSMTGFSGANRRPSCSDLSSLKVAKQMKRTTAYLTDVETEKRKEQAALAGINLLEEQLVGGLDHLAISPDQQAENAREKKFDDDNSSGGGESVSSSASASIDAAILLWSQTGMWSTSSNVLPASFESSKTQSTPHPVNLMTDVAPLQISPRGSSILQKTSPIAQVEPLQISSVRSSTTRRTSRRRRPENPPVTIKTQWSYEGLWCLPPLKPINEEDEEEVTE